MQGLPAGQGEGVPYARAGPSAYLHDINLLIDTPAEISCLLNLCRIRRVDHFTCTHLALDHVEGFPIVEQIALDFRTWRAYPEKQISLLLPEDLNESLRGIQSQYGLLVDFYEKSGFIRLVPFRGNIQIGPVSIGAIPVSRGSQIAFVYVFGGTGRRILYAPCDVNPFPEHRTEVQQPDILVIQPGIFESGLKHHFKYPADHISRITMYTLEQTLQWGHAARRERSCLSILRSTGTAATMIIAPWSRTASVLPTMACG
jgi:phosphoribosyl 1,2-cyclic phosphate phosphodiesterase